jgi:hypothetical protein
MDGWRGILYDVAAAAAAASIPYIESYWAAACLQALDAKSSSWILWRKGVVLVVEREERVDPRPLKF